MTKILFSVTLHFSNVLACPCRQPAGQTVEVFTMEIIHTPAAPEAIGPYSQAIRHGDLVFTSGQIPICPETGLLAGDEIEAQAEQVMKNVQAVL